MRKFWFISGVLFLQISGIVMGGNSSSHTITIRVLHPIEMNIETRSETQQTSGSSIHQSAEFTDQSIISVLKWKSDQYDKKVTVSTEQQTAYYQVQIEGIHCTGGVINHGFNRGSFAQDFITDISTLQGLCEVRTVIDVDSFFKSDSVLPRVVYTITDIY
ncbi:hypothetical protein JW824_01750 [bacterium]|nr:hypothetical protein [bacterium]